MNTEARRSRKQAGAVGVAVGMAAIGALVFVATNKENAEEERVSRPVLSVRDAITPQANPVTPIEVPGPKWERESGNVVDSKPDPIVEAERVREAAERNRSAIGKDALAQLPKGSFASLTDTSSLSSGFTDKNVYSSDSTGSFGYSRPAVDPSTNWGTIGTNVYGRIPSYGGYSGYGISGGGRMRRTDGPKTTLATPVVDGDLDKSIVRRYLKRNIQKLAYCYEKELLAKPGIAGTLAMSFTILESGTVSGATANGIDPAVGECVVRVLAGIEYPKPKGNAPAKVSVTLDVRPS